MSVRCSVCSHLPAVELVSSQTEKDNMGTGHSQEEINTSVAMIHTNVVNVYPHFLPDIGLDESMLKYSGIDSNAQLKAFAKLNADGLPALVDKVGTRLAPLTAVPSAVGLGALVVSLVLELIVKAGPESESSYDMFRRVFGEEKASSVRDTMSEYIGLHRTYINNERQMIEELKRLKAQLYSHLMSLRNSLLMDGQMSTRGLKIWINGAAFHIQMMIHEARLSLPQGGNPELEYVQAISNAIDLHVDDLAILLPKYKAFKLSKTFMGPTILGCVVRDEETNVHLTLPEEINPCYNPVRKPYIDLVFSTHKPITSLKGYFSGIKNNLSILINQQDSFPLAPAA